MIERHDLSPPVSQRVCDFAGGAIILALCLAAFWLLAKVL